MPPAQRPPIPDDVSDAIHGGDPEDPSIDIAIDITEEPLDDESLDELAAAERTTVHVKAAAPVEPEPRDEPKTIPPPGGITAADIAAAFAEDDPPMRLTPIDGMMRAALSHALIRDPLFCERPTVVIPIRKVWNSRTMSFEPGYDKVRNDPE